MRKMMPLLLVAAIVAAGCGSSGSTKTSSSSSPSSGASAAPVALTGKVNDKGTGDATSGKLDVEVNDFYFEPTYLKVTPGSTVTLTLKNEGKAQHTFTSDALGVDQALAPGQSMDLTVTVPSALPVEVHCRFHQASGMQGALFDTTGGSAGASASATNAATTPTTAGYYN